MPGLGTRAVDRVSDDYPVLVSPSQPNLRVNVSTDEVVRYSPKKIDVIDLEENTFVTKDIQEVLRDVGHEFPALTKIFSIYQDGVLQRPMGLATDIGKAESVVTFDGLISGTPFMLQLEAILKTLSSGARRPGRHRVRLDGDGFLPPAVPSAKPGGRGRGHGDPREPPRRRPSCSRPGSTSRTAVSPTSPTSSMSTRTATASSPISATSSPSARPSESSTSSCRGASSSSWAPGRWGSRGDIKLGVRVTYSEINNSAMLIEVARKKGNYVPDVSFGTHFFQDLVESGIRYLPLYPDDEGVKFNEKFLGESRNTLADHCPECAGLTGALRVIDVPEATGGKVLRVVMNADQGMAVGYFAAPEAAVQTACPAGGTAAREDEDHFRWRLRMAERIAFHCGAQKWGVRGVYFVDTSDGGEIDPASPIRIIVHFQGTGRQRKELETWLQGWSLSLAEMNYFRTGFHADGLLDVQFLTDEKLRGEKDVAARIKAGSDTVRELPLGPKAPE